ncbi:MAG: GH1 family beta-glucosidase [Bacteroidota bacterium]
MSFPETFLWGAATSAYQIEGAPLADGAGASIWHRFTHTPGQTASGETGDVACDHYHRWRDDLDLIASLGLEAYRFSIAWARVFPGGTGPLNAPGLDWYERLVDGLLERGIEPFPTLYHWDLPAALDDRGGWTSPDAPQWFAEYTHAVVDRLSDRVTRWTTFNEPWVLVDGGYVSGAHAPGRRDRWAGPRAAHTVLLSHAAGAEAARAAGADEVGIVANLVPRLAASDLPEDVAAANRASAYLNRWFLDPLFGKGYPEEMAEIFGAGWPAWPGDDLDRIASARPDFVGVNYYLVEHYRAAPEVWPTRAAVVRQPQATHTEMGWAVHAPGLTDTLREVAERYGNPPVYITENGAAFYDPPTVPPAGIQDPLRVQYFRDHVRAVSAALDAGCDVRGYFAWSLMDNFEWAEGYAKRFGIVHVDFETLERTPKASARFYAEVARSNGAAALLEPAALG